MNEEEIIKAVKIGRLDKNGTQKYILTWLAPASIICLVLSVLGLSLDIIPSSYGGVVVVSGFALIFSMFISELSALHVVKVAVDAQIAQKLLVQILRDSGYTLVGQNQHWLKFINNRTHSEKIVFIFWEGKIHFNISVPAEDKQLIGRMSKQRLKRILKSLEDANHSSDPINRGIGT